MYLESEDNGPDETECETVAAVHDVVSAHVLQMHALLVQECQRLVHVLQAVDTHLTLGRPWLKQSNITVKFASTDRRTDRQNGQSALVNVYINSVQLFLLLQRT